MPGAAASHVSRFAEKPCFLEQRQTSLVRIKACAFFQFSHVGLTQKTPESITSATLKESYSPHLSQQVEGKLPSIYKIREKQAVNNNFPFSAHDNRHSFQNSGYYLDTVSVAPGTRGPAGRQGSALPDTGGAGGQSSARDRWEGKSRPGLSESSTTFSSSVQCQR
ncbi:Testis-expressed protein 36 [Galemys pyrenaicus]|uniref:Testis-expressed protein 36 n=1 Tax=Galemys pyrenaicus TaxID=202257 RepID=A0A8J6A9B4_GALPY|nr:Testis-expressed protein 36 [Galemys pyrenaicus]